MALVLGIMDEVIDGGLKPMPQSLEDEFGDIIKKARKGQAYSSEEVGNLAGIAPADLADLEAYSREPTDKEIEALAALFKLDAAKLADIAHEAWSPDPEPWQTESSVIIKPIPVDVGGYTENSYVVACRSTGRALVVDPGGSVESIFAAVRESGLEPEAIAITHGHSDHTAGAAAVAAGLGILSLIGPDEALSAVTSAGLSKRRVNDGDSFAIGNLVFRAIHTPGHTPGSFCYLAGLTCFVGDTLFAGSVGGAMGGAGSYGILLESVKSKLLSLPGRTALLPGHGPATTVDEELSHNPFF
jgi:hydroxyacylglutathione hydrolase